MTRRRSPRHAFDETWVQRWKRRAITGPGLLVATPLYLAALPATLAATAAADIARGRPWTASRFAAALGVNLSMHVAGFGGVFAAWLLGGQWAGAGPERERRLDQRMQVLWARATWAASARLYRMRLDVDGSNCASPGPVLVLSRHASLLDTLLPVLILSGPQEMRLRYVMKRELLWDPILDAIGHRWPTAFVRRDTRAPREVAHVTLLLDGLNDRSAIVVFPEGTRFTEEKRVQVLQRLRESSPERFERAARLRHVLPPRPGGVLALLGANPAIDVVVLAHTGLEGANHFDDLMSGTLIGTTVRATLWRIPRSQIPTDPDAQIEWLEGQWERVDDWIHEHRSAKRADTRPTHDAEAPRWPMGGPDLSPP